MLLDSNRTLCFDLTGYQLNMQLVTYCDCSLACKVGLPIVFQEASPAEEWLFVSGSAVS